MPGAADTNLRRAYCQEDLGAVLLRGVAAVAPVPASQDVGIDTICTLLKPSGSRRLQAEGSFYVQLKARSVEEVIYSGDEIDWFCGLELPFFIGCVDLQTASISLRLI